MKKKKRLCFIENFQLLKFIDAIILTLHYIFGTLLFSVDGIAELIKNEVLNLGMVSEPENCLNFLIITIITNED